MTWHVWTDGSCQHGLANVPKRTPGWGGWAAIVEHGSEGFVLRGRVPRTTNVRMELRAASEGLSALPLGAACILHTDCTTILIVRNAWEGGRLDGKHGAEGQPDCREWRALAHQFWRLDVRVQLIVRHEVDPIHRRAHAYAGLEARGGLRNLPINATPLDDSHHVRRGYQRRQLRAQASLR